MKFSTMALKIFHHANGLSCMLEGPMWEEEEEEEHITRTNRVREQKDIEVITGKMEQGQTWRKIKCTTLLLGEDVVKNPYKSRIYYPKPEMHSWIRDFRNLCEWESNCHGS
jgi:hypothetical protein